MIDDITSNTVLKHFVVAGGWITWFVLIPLSVLTVALSINYLITIRRGTQTPVTLAKTLLAAARQGQVRNILEITRDDDTMLGQAAYRGVSQIDQANDAALIAIEEAADEQASRLMRRIEYLNVVGNVSPMIGLLGTVVGMIQAFNRIYAAGEGVPQASKLVGDIAIALVNTFWGLAIAIPALTIYAFFRNRVEAITAECVKVCEHIVTLLSRGGHSGQAAGDLADTIHAGPR
jgi:biopolymer transport protein ExbB